MRKVKEKELANGKASNLKAQLSGILIFTLLILFFAIYSNHVYAENSTEKVTLKQWDNPKEYTAEIDKSGRLFWCGKDTIGLVKKLGRDKAAIVFYKNDLSDFKEDILNISASDYVGFSCSDDAQYIYYTHQLDDKDNREFGYYDRKNKTFKRVFTFDKNLSIKDTAKIISPQHTYIVGPNGIDKISLPGIGNLKVIPISILTDENHKGQRLYHDLDWDRFERRLYLLYSDSVTYVEPNTLRKETVELKKNEKYEIIGMEASSNPDRLFIIAFTKKDIRTNVYLLNLTNKKKPISVFLSDIYTFNTSQAGILIYSKQYGYKEQGGDGYFENDPAKRYIAVNLIDDNRKEKRLKKIHFGTEVNSPRIFKPWSSPIISKQGNAIIFINDIEKKIYEIQIK